jgi:hypothetical protein
MLKKERKSSSRCDTSEKAGDILIPYMQKTCVSEVHIVTVTHVEKICKPQADSLETGSNSDIQSLKNWEKFSILRT